MYSSVKLNFKISRRFEVNPQKLFLYYISFKIENLELWISKTEIYSLLWLFKKALKSVLYAKAMDFATFLNFENWFKTCYELIAMLNAAS